VKADATGWYERTAQNALDKDADLLLINGRQPRQVLSRWLGRTGVVPTIEFWAQCDSVTAAERVLLGRKKPIADADKEHEQKNIENRRAADMLHTEFPVIPPKNAVHYIHYPTLAEVTSLLAVQESWQTNGCPDTTEADLPRPIIFDNTNMSKNVMKRTAGLLVANAIRVHPSEK
jgi:hypothetical protein